MGGGPRVTGEHPGRRAPGLWHFTHQGDSFPISPLSLAQWWPLFLNFFLAWVSLSSLQPGFLSLLLFTAPVNYQYMQGFAFLDADAVLTLYNPGVLTLGSPQLGRSTPWPPSCINTTQLWLMSSCIWKSACETKAGLEHVFVSIALEADTIRSQFVRPSHSVFSELD